MLSLWCSKNEFIAPSRRQLLRRDSSDYSCSWGSRDRPRPTRHAQAHGISRAEPLASWYGDEGAKGPPGLPAVAMLVVGVTCKDGTAGRTRTHAAPRYELSPNPPRMAVLPSPD